MNLNFSALGLGKNNAESCVKHQVLDQDMAMVKLHNQNDFEVVIRETLDKSLIQFYFNLQEKTLFSFHAGSYQKALDQGQSFLLYNPQDDLPLEVNLAPEGRMLCIFVSVSKIHKMFLNEGAVLTFLNSENINKKFYNIQAIAPQLYVVLEQLFFNKMEGATAKLYHRAKLLESLSLFFSKEDEKETESCPFLNDEVNVDKIRQAKKIIIERMSQPPSLKDLAKEVGLNEYQLKVGFKNIYGTTVYGYLNDYKMDQAREMLQTGKFKVNEVAYEIGYSNPSHFIAAFKKKYDITPKKFLSGLNLSMA